MNLCPLNNVLKLLEPEEVIMTGVILLIIAVVSGAIMFLCFLNMPLVMWANDPNPYLPYDVGEKVVSRRYKIGYVAVTAIACLVFLGDVIAAFLLHV